MAVVTERKKSRITYLLAAEESGRMEIPSTEMKLEVFVGGGRFRSSAFDILYWQRGDVKQAV